MDWDLGPGAGFVLANRGYNCEHAQIYDVLRKKGANYLHDPTQSGADGAACFIGFGNLVDD